MPPRKKSRNITLTEIGALIIILGAAYSVWTNYPTIHPITQGLNEVVPLKLINNQQSNFQLRNDGAISVIIIVNFSSDGNIRFKNDKGQIQDSFEVPYEVNSNSISSFSFIPIINNSLENATLFIKYNSHLEKAPSLEPQQSKGYLSAFYEKTYEYYGAEPQWKLNQSKYLPIK